MLFVHLFPAANLVPHMNLPFPVVIMQLKKPMLQW